MCIMSAHPAANGHGLTLASRTAGDRPKSLKRGRDLDTTDDTTDSSIDPRQPSRKVVRRSSSDLAEDRSKSAESESSEEEEETPDDSSGSSEDESDEVSSSEESSDSGSERETLIPLSRRPKKPDFKVDAPSSDLRQRLRAFLPEMERANQELDLSIGDGNTNAMLEIEATEDDDSDEGDEPNDIKLDESDVGEDQEPYIEMNLGLGVLEEKTSDQTASTSPSSDSTTDAEANVMAKLLGRGKGKRATGIEEL